MKKLASIREDYTQQKLSRKSVDKDPIVQFRQWMNEAIDAKVNEPTAMTISTVGKNNRPSSRTVLLKGVEYEGFVFFTNYESRKGTHLARSPFASLLFFWPELERQVIIEGHVRKIDATASDEYFQSRPWKSRLGARISPQSQEIPDRTFIKMAFAKESLKFAGRKVPRPENWGGYVVEPDRMEFWQGRSSRLHDRILFKKEGNAWNISRLAP